MVEGNGLENRRSREATVGSNPTLSAKFAKRVKRSSYRSVKPIRRTLFIMPKTPYKLLIRERRCKSHIQARKTVTPAVNLS